MKLTRFHALKIIDWCRGRYGRSKYNGGIPILEFKKPEWYREDLMGDYDSEQNVIYVNPLQHGELIELAKTIIEEYCHYLNSDAQYQKLYENHTYDTHPHEIACKGLSEREAKKCIEYLKRMHRQFQD